MTAPRLVQKLWNYCNILRDDGPSYGDNALSKRSPIPKRFGWDKLVKLDGDDLETHYRHPPTELGRRTGMLGTIFRKAQNT